MAVPTLYRHTGVVLVRASTDPGDLHLPDFLDSSDPALLAAEGTAWLAKLWSRPEISEALRVASPTLAASVDQHLNNGSGVSATRLRRLILAITSYLIRWQRRATPFGMFAGITAAAIGPAAASIGTAHRAVITADADWLAVLVEELETHPDLRGRLAVVADNTAIVRDGRIIVAGRSAPSTRVPGQPREVSARYTRPVRAALTAAATPIGWDELAAHLSARFPAVPAAVVQSLLNSLVDQGFLITNLRSPMTAPDGLTHLTSTLRAAGAADLPGLSALLGRLDAIHAQLAQHNTNPHPERAAAIRSAVAHQMTALTAAVEQPIAIDMRLDAEISVPEPVLAEAQLAASVLLRLTLQPFGATAWLDYQARFRARYGAGVLVPVRDLVADSGLGYPGGYLGAQRARPVWRTLTERDTALLPLIQKATLSDAGEVVLTDADVAALTVGDHDTIIPPPRVELGVAVDAVSTDAIDRGDFTLRVTAAPKTHTTMAGRFTHLLDEADRARLAATYATENQPGVVAVQLSFPPRVHHDENVTRVGPFMPTVVSLAEHSSGEGIDIEDLAVTADATQLYLVQISTGRRVVPQIPHALDTTIRTPPLARFLAEVADARSAVFGPFDLGCTRALPYIPRIRHRRTILVAARWILNTSDLPTTATQVGWDTALAEWRRQWRVPARVIARHDGMRLPLDLDQALDRALLRARLARAERLDVLEDGPADGQGWIGRPCELLIPMTVTDPAARPLPLTVAPGAILRPGDSPVVHAQLEGNPARFDDLLTLHLPGLATSLGELVEYWWATRHRDLIQPDTPQHLGLFLRLPSAEAYGPVAARLAAFAADLASRGLPGQLTLVPYPQHPGRYGHGPALDAAERVFATDTTAALAQITASTAAAIPGQALAAAAMARLAAGFGPDPDAGYQALLGCLGQQTGPLDRALRDQALDLADPRGDFAAIRALPGGDAVLTAWQARDKALAVYREVLAAQRDPATVLRSLLHGHHVRALGVDPEFERTTERLARALALRHLATAGGR